MIRYLFAPILLLCVLLACTFQKQNAYLHGLGFGDDAPRFHDVLVSGVGHFYFNVLIFSIILTVFLCIVTSIVLYASVASKNKILTFFCIILAILSLLTPYIINPVTLDFRNTVTQRHALSLPRVAHAGGGYQGHTYTNSLNALNLNRDHYVLFELDFSWTTDGHLVCLHDWDVNFRHFFNLDYQGPVSLKKFMRLAENHHTFRKCTLDNLPVWLDSNPHARIVTDIKKDNLQALKKIADYYPEYQNRFIPQVYQPWEYYIARNLGYDDVILTLYAYHGSDEDVLYWLPHMDLFGLAMPRYRADRGLARMAREKTGVLSWVHTINAQEELETYLAKGVANIYTDWLVP